ncbi:MAG: NAD-dependent protein deacylase [bacterium]
MSIPSEDIERAQNHIEQADSVFVVTGAGVSAESGVPTFRTAGGIWNQIDPMKVATPEAFAADPKLVWEFYDQRRINLTTCSPNPGHHTLAQLEKQKEHMLILTQNVDSLHEDAGSESVIHIHGSIWEVRCTKCGKVDINREAPLAEMPPHCKCGALLRPNVVWFGETISPIQCALVDRFLEQHPPQVVLVIGTEASFGYIISWALESKRHDGILVEINPGRTDLSNAADICLRGPSGDILPKLVA